MISATKYCPSLLVSQHWAVGKNLSGTRDDGVDSFITKDLTCLHNVHFTVITINASVKNNWFA